MTIGEMVVAEELYLLRRFLSLATHQTWHQTAAVSWMTCWSSWTSDVAVGESQAVLQRGLVWRAAALMGHVRGRQLGLHLLYPPVVCWQPAAKFWQGWNHAAAVSVLAPAQQRLLQTVTVVVMELSTKTEVTEGLVICLASWAHAVLIASPWTACGLRTALPAGCPTSLLAHLADLGLNLDQKMAQERMSQQGCCD